MGWAIYLYIPSYLLVKIKYSISKTLDAGEIPQMKVAYFGCRPGKLDWNSICDSYDQASVSFSPNNSTGLVVSRPISKASDSL